LQLSVTASRERPIFWCSGSDSSRTQYLVVTGVLTTLFGQAPSAFAAVSGTADFPVTLAGATTGQVPLATAWRFGTGYVFTVSGMDVQPSRLSSDLQHVSVFYQVQAKGISSSGWQTVASNVAGADLTQWVPNPWDNPENDGEMLVAGGKQLPTMQFPTLRATTAKLFRVVVTVSWSIETGLQLGKRTLTPQIAGDLRCPAMVTQCQVVQVGSPVFLLYP
jgi:hypothetical protein